MEVWDADAPHPRVNRADRQRGVPRSGPGGLLSERQRRRNEEDVSGTQNPADTKTWLEMLFRPGDLFEVRTQAPGQRGTTQSWLPYAKIPDFAQTHVPIHAGHNRHVWVGIAPRPKVKNTTPVLHRALWCDFSASVTSLDAAKQAIETANIPPATMLVWSGNGVHGYWALKNEAGPEAVKPYAKGLHAALPTDSTHDSTRIMRVPGSTNPKDLEHPSSCYIAEHDPERVYELLDFPKAEVNRPVVTGAKPAQMTPLSQDDRELFLANWIDGQKHAMVVGVAGYLRKNLYYDEDSAIAEISRLHEAAGHEVDDGLVKAVNDTYAQLWAKVSGLRKLEELGIAPAVSEGFRFSFKAPKKPKIEIINFHDTLEEQEFWIEGLVGPGLLTLWAAEPKTGKSFAAMQMGYALASGTPLWDFNTIGTPLRVLYFQGELSKGMVYGRAKSMFGLGAIRDPERFAMTAKPPEPIDLVKHPEVLTDLADDYDVIIVDPISVFITNDESKSYAVNEVIGVFDYLRSKGKAIILVHHTRKLQTDREGTPVEPTFNDIRGSGAWFATADALALHYRTGQDGHTGVKFMFRAAPDRDPLPLYRMPNGGFTADKSMYLATNPGFRSTVADQSN